VTSEAAVTVGERRPGRALEMWGALLLAALGDAMCLAIVAARGFVERPLPVPDEVFPAAAALAGYAVGHTLLALASPPILRRVERTGIAVLSGFARAGIVVFLAWVHSPLAALGTAAIIGAGSGLSYAARERSRAARELAVSHFLVLLAVVPSLHLLGALGERPSFTGACAAYLLAAFLLSGAGADRAPGSSVRSRS
jgi:hypothetical protein